MVVKPPGVLAVPEEPGLDPEAVARKLLGVELRGARLAPRDDVDERPREDPMDVDTDVFEATEL